MTTPEDRIRAAKAELDGVIERAQQDLYRFQRRNEPTPEALRALQEAAARGDLGEDMRELARRIESGRDSWQAVFAGDSPNAALLRGHLERMAEENREAIATAVEEDESFDPFATSSDL